MTTLAFAKLNLTFEVVGKRSDGYHEVRSVMQSVDFGDTVSIVPAAYIDAPNSTEMHCITTGGGVRLPWGTKNSAVKAYNLFRDTFGLPAEQLDININKVIPICGGLGGSSTDGSAVLRLLNGYCGTGLSTAELQTLAAKLDSDAAFCISGGTALATGRGELLEALPPLPDCGIVIVKPNTLTGLVTTNMFAAFDRVKLRMKPDHCGLTAALKAGDTAGIARRLYNVFVEVLPRSYKEEISDAIGALLNVNALGASMTGSGSCVFGLFETTRKADSAAEELRADGFECWSVAALLTTSR
ncbi:MAG: 4-(cytidine 5'-diphospho)-2-C-methyl-D-erythritol kinase [Oscillospiraceae bacterium]|nr:4-(cytidine 5'-diphospho)-2-C-methyl-D-erythritol kinase [Oscillospiraceae bacterium]